MIEVSIDDFRQNISHYINLALAQPVAITQVGREPAVMIAAEEYRRLKRRDREALLAEELTDAELEAIERAEAPRDSASSIMKLDR